MRGVIPHIAASVTVLPNLSTYSSAGCKRLARANRSCSSLGLTRPVAIGVSIISGFLNWDHANELHANFIPARRCRWGREVTYPGAAPSNYVAAPVPCTRTAPFLRARITPPTRQKMSMPASVRARFHNISCPTSVVIVDLSPLSESRRTL